MILVVGATAFFGRQAVETLAARNIPVRALTRDPSAAALAAGVEVVRAAVVMLDRGIPGHGGPLTRPE